MGSTKPMWSSSHEDVNRSHHLEESQKYNSLDGQPRYRKHSSSSGTITPPYIANRRSAPSSRHSTPTACRRHKFLCVPRQSSESLAGSGASSRAGTPFRSMSSENLRHRSRSVSPRPKTESDAIKTPGIQQEAFTRAFIYPSSLHHNLRLVGLLLVMAHVSYKTIGTWLIVPFLNKISYDWTPRSLTIGVPWSSINNNT